MNTDIFGGNPKNQKRKNEKNASGTLWIELINRAELERN
jgi:hypothetical protein